MTSSAEPLPATTALAQAVRIGNRTAAASLVVTAAFALVAALVAWELVAGTWERWLAAALTALAFVTAGSAAAEVLGVEEAVVRLLQRTDAVHRAVGFAVDELRDPGLLRPREAVVEDIGLVGENAEAAVRAAVAGGEEPRGARALVAREAARRVSRQTLAAVRAGTSPDALEARVNARIARTTVVLGVAAAVIAVCVALACSAIVVAVAR